MSVEMELETRGVACFWCGVEFQDGPDAPALRRRTRDHVVPRCRGGRGGQNVVWACVECNIDKGQSMPAQWAARVSPTFSPERQARIRERCAAIILSLGADLLPPQPVTPNRQHRVKLVLEEYRWASLYQAGLLPPDFRL
jgi:hypothetical protein